MAILFNAGTDQVNWGDVTQFDGLTALSISWWANLTDTTTTADGRRWISKWGDNAGGLAFLVAQVAGDGDDIVLGISETGITDTGFTAYKSTSSFLTTGTNDHYVMTWNGSNNAFTLRRNDVDIPLSDLFTTSPPPVSIANVPTVFAYGQDGATVPLDGMLGSLWEVGIWNRVLTPREKTSLSKGYAPQFLSQGLIHYADCIRDVNDRIRGTRPTVTSVDVTPHSRIIYPRSGKTSFRSQRRFIQEHIGRGIGRGIFVGR